jgi:hypothetical protein
MVPLYRISWTDPNGNAGHGEYSLSLELAQNWIDHLEKKYPTMRHWMELDPTCA